MNDNEQEIHLFNIQQVASALFIVSILISMYLTNQTINDLKYNTTTDNRKITEFNRYLSLSLLVLFLITTYYFYQIAKTNNEDLRPFKLQLLASSLAVVVSLIILYTFYLNNSIADSENPVS